MFTRILELTYIKNIFRIIKKGLEHHLDWTSYVQPIYMKAVRLVFEIFTQQSLNHILIFFIVVNNNC